MKQLTEQDIDAIVAKVKQELMAEIKPKIESGKVYHTKKGGLFFVSITQDEDDWYKGYGFDEYWVYSESWSLRGTYCLGKEATPQEWEVALIKEACRLYKVGVNVSSLYKPDCFFGEIISNPYLNDKHNQVWVKGDKCNILVFENGTWAEVIKSKPLDESKLITDTKELIKEGTGSAEATALVQFVTVGGKDYQLTVNLKLV